MLEVLFSVGRAEARTKEEARRAKVEANCIFGFEVGGFEAEGGDS